MRFLLFALMAVSSAVSAQRVFPDVVYVPTPPEVVDEMLSLARSMARVDGLTAVQRAQQLALADARWHAALGPQHHGHGCAMPEEGYRWIPMELWWDAVATIARFFPGAKALTRRQVVESHQVRATTPIVDDALLDLSPTVREALSANLARWMAVDPTERPSMRQLAEDLEVLLLPQREAEEEIREPGAGHRPRAVRASCARRWRRSPGSRSPRPP